MLNMSKTFPKCIVELQKSQTKAKYIVQVVFIKRMTNLKTHKMDCMLFANPMLLKLFLSNFFFNFTM